METKIHKKIKFLGIVLFVDRTQYWVTFDIRVRKVLGIVVFQDITFKN